MIDIDVASVRRGLLVGIRHRLVTLHRYQADYHRVPFKAYPEYPVTAPIQHILSPKQIGRDTAALRPFN